MDLLYFKVVDLIELFDKTRSEHNMDKKFEVMMDILDQYEINNLSIELKKAAPNETYGRNLLEHTDEREIIIMNWNHNEQCLPHDHGDSVGAVKILQGTATQIIYIKTAHGYMVRSVEIRKTGEILIVPKGMIHAMGNSTDERLVTGHIYMKPITRMKIYDFIKGQYAIVSDDCGAWWPTKSEQLLEVNSLTNLGNVASKAA